jgi:beta-N-acetylhexosaminidase
MELIDQSISRIMKLKQKYQVKDAAVPAPDIKQLNTTANRLLNTYLHK